MVGRIANWGVHNNCRSKHPMILWCLLNLDHSWFCPSGSVIERANVAMEASPWGYQHAGVTRRY